MYICIEFFFLFLLSCSSFCSFFFFYEKKSFKRFSWYTETSFIKNMFHGKNCLNVLNFESHDTGNVSFRYIIILLIPSNFRNYSLLLLNKLIDIVGGHEPAWVCFFFMRLILFPLFLSKDQINISKSGGCLFSGPFWNH